MAWASPWHRNNMPPIEFVTSRGGAFEFVELFTRMSGEFDLAGGAHEVSLRFGDWSLVSTLIFCARGANKTNEGADYSSYRRTNECEENRCNRPKQRTTSIAIGIRYHEIEEPKYG
ncbi:hypothetical protein IAD21_03196 [Abditibacteriota bacterium]|nr:hypothetical protein IAD21_03196 [Abditibacteriota bacterium]